MKSLLISILSLYTAFSFAQTSFEPFPAVPHLEFGDWETEIVTQGQETFQQKQTVAGFFNGHPLTIKLISYASHPNQDSEIEIYFKDMLIQRLFENMPFSRYTLKQALRVADFDGDGRTDLKLVLSYLGEGTDVLKSA